MANRPGDHVVHRARSTKSPAAAQQSIFAGEITTPDEGSIASRLLRYGGTVALLGAITVALLPVRESVGLLNIGLVYLIVVIGMTVFGGRRAGVLASLLGFALLNYFLVPPYLTFIISDLHNILALFVFLGVSLLISWLLADANEQARQAQLRADDISRLYELSQAIIGAQSTGEILPAVAQKVCEVFEAQSSWILLPDEKGQLLVAAQAPSGVPAPGRDEMSLAAWAFRHGSEVGRSGAKADQPRSEVMSHAAFVPLQAAQRTVGVLAVMGKRSGRPFTPAERTVLMTFAGQAAVALERLYLLGEAQRAEMLARTDELKSALMSAVSHDLRTPLASITASVTSLLDRDISWEEETRRDFLQGIYDEARRLNRLVGNLLDMSRIEGGGLHPEKDWYAVTEVIEAVVQRLEPRLAEHPVNIEVADDIPLILLDFAELDQVFTNLLENAIKYTAPGTAVTIEAKRVADHVQISVQDNGAGVPPHAIRRLFDKFYRVDKRSESQGTGLGLAITKGLVEAHGGTIWAENSRNGGLRVVFTLPITLYSPRSAGKLSA